MRPLSIKCRGGDRVVSSQTGGSIPHGLALTLVPLLDSADGWAEWTVTHIDSGMRVGPGWQERRDAQRCAEFLAGLADWTDPAAILLADANLQDTVAEMVLRCAEELTPTEEPS